MNPITRDEVIELLGREDSPSISIYLPTHRKGPETQQDPHRLKNLLREAQKEAEEQGLSGSRIQSILAPANELLPEEDFWQHQGEGLALFLAPDFHRVHRLPVECPELVSVASSYHVKPLLGMLHGDGRYLVLAISQKRVRLFEGSRWHARELDAKGVPRGIAEALWMDDMEKSLQLHTLGGQKTGGGRAQAVMHGHGAAEEDQKNRLLRYFRSIDKALSDLLSSNSMPLLLAGVEYYLPLYKQANTHPGLRDTVIAGNPDNLGAEDIRAKAWEILEPAFLRAEHEAVARFEQLAGTGKTSTELDEVVRAARNGKVQTLLAAQDSHCWGRVNVDGEATVERHGRRRAGDVDLVDAAAAATLQHGGTVFPRRLSDMPEHREVAAVYRY